jgi:hypothetical protein
MYALLSCTAVYFVLTVIYATREPSRKHLVINAIAGVLLLFSHFYGGFVFAGINLFVLSSLLQKRAWVKVSWKDWIIAQTITVAIFSPWARIMFERANSVREEGFWIPELSAGFIVENLAFVAGGELALVGFCLLGLIAVLSPKPVGTGSGIHKENPGFARRFLSVFAVDWRLGLVLVWLFSSLFFGLIVTAVIDQNILQARYLSGSVPAFLLLAAVGIRQLQFSRPLQLLALSAAIAVSLPAVHHSLKVRDRSDPQAVISSIQTQYITGDQMLVYKPWLFHLFEYYLQGTEISSHIIPGPESIEQWTPDSDRFWVLTLHMGETETREMFNHLVQTHEIAFSRLDNESQAYLFVQKTNTPRD